MDRKRVSEPSPVGSVWRAAPTSLYTPGRRDSSALSIMPARFTSTSVTVSPFIIFNSSLRGSGSWNSLSFFLVVCKSWRWIPRDAVLEVVGATEAFLWGTCKMHGNLNSLFSLSYTLSFPFLGEDIFVFLIMNWN